jgi:hypothetical protein
MHVWYKGSTFWRGVLVLCGVACGGGSTTELEPELPVEVPAAEVSIATTTPQFARLDLCTRHELRGDQVPDFVPVPEGLRALTRSDCEGDAVSGWACEALVSHIDPDAKWNADADGDTVWGFAGGRVRTVLVAESLEGAASLEDVVKFYGARLNQDGWILMEYEHTTLVARRAADCIATVDVGLQPGALRVVVTLRGG